MRWRKCGACCGRTAACSSPSTGSPPDEAARRWQNRFNPLWGRFTGGCNLNRKIDDLVRAAGFTIVDIDTAYGKGLRPMSYIYTGRAAPE